MNSNTVESIAAYVPLSELLATAGQPSEAQLGSVAAAGFKVVINLALHDDPTYSLKDEAATVEALGLQYVHIPVQFSSPQLSDLAAFLSAMEQAGKSKVLVHCRHNKRVPVFVALHRILKLGWNRSAALSAMREVWQPDETWEKFIAQALVQREG
jgi:uncharacterized protein (TIGR01244 family)